MTDVIIQKTVKLADIEKIDIHGKLWNDVHANTYHSVQVSVLLKGDDKYTDLGFIAFRYGYDNCYEQSALMVLEKSVAGWNPKEKAIHWIADELGLKIDSRKEWVKRKRDM